MYAKKFAKIHIYITILACIAMISVNIYLQASLFDVAVRLIITIMMFYVIGKFAALYIRTKIFPPPIIEPAALAANDDMDKAPKIYETGEQGDFDGSDTEIEDIELDDADDFDSDF